MLVGVPWASGVGEGKKATWGLSFLSRHVGPGLANSGPQGEKEAPLSARSSHQTVFVVVVFFVVVLFFCLVFFKTRYLCVALAVLELTL